MRTLVRHLVPSRWRARLRALLERSRLNSRDVDQIRRVAAEQWRTVWRRSPRHAESYWGGVDDPRSDSVGKRRSGWLAGLEPFREARSVIELGCSAGRNLYVLQQRYPEMALCGVDINAEAIEFARARIRGEFLVGDLYDLDALLGNRAADVIFTMGVLIHLHPDTVPPLLAVVARRARRWVVLVEQVSFDNAVVKGPAGWRPKRRVTGEYIQWSPDLPGMLEKLGFHYILSDVPVECQTNGARHLIIVPTEGT